MGSAIDKHAYTARGLAFFACVILSALALWQFLIASNGTSSNFATAWILLGVAAFLAIVLTIQR